MKDKIIELIKKNIVPKWNISSVHQYYTVTGEEIDTIATEIEALYSEQIDKLKEIIKEMDWLMDSETFTDDLILINRSEKKIQQLKHEAGL